MRVAEIVGTLSIAADFGSSMPDSHGLRGATIAGRFAQLLGVDDRTVRDAYYLPLLAMAGCSAESHTAAHGLGDEVALGAELYGLDWGRKLEVLPAMLRMVLRGKRPFDGLISSARAIGMLGQMPQVTRKHAGRGLDPSHTSPI